MEWSKKKLTEEHLLIFKIKKVFKIPDSAPAGCITKCWEVQTTVNCYWWRLSNRPGEGWAPRAGGSAGPQSPGLAGPLGAGKPGRGWGVWEEVGGQVGGRWGLEGRGVGSATPSRVCFEGNTTNLSASKSSHHLAQHPKFYLSPFPLDLERLSASEASLEEKCHKPLWVRIKRHSAKGKAL